MEDKHRFGFQVSSDIAQKFMAILVYKRRSDLKFNLSDNFVAMVELAYALLPEDAQMETKSNEPTDPGTQPSEAEPADVF
jgi:hypothetical protein